MIETSPGWTKLSDPERLALVERLDLLRDASTTDRSQMAKQLGPLPKAIERTVWDALAVDDPDAPIVNGRQGHPEPDPELRDNESVPLPGEPIEWAEDPSPRIASPDYRAAIDNFVAAEVYPFVADAWVDHSKTRIGYEIPLTRQFHRYAPPRPLEEIDREIRDLEAEIQDAMARVLR
jgi:type I restriction enzyme M protein